MRLLVSLLCPTLCAAGVLGLAGCQDLTSVDAPDVVQPGDYASAAGATALAVGALTRFHFTFGGGEPGLVMASGSMADELLQTFSFDADWDGRNALDPSPSSEPYTGLHDTRQRLLSAIASFQQAAPDSSARIGQLFAFVGYTTVFFGENYCAGVPLSHRDAALRPVYGHPLTTAQLFDSALAAFDSAVVYGAADARIADLARVGRGRALLDQGRFSEAAQAVTSVPTSYAYDVAYVTGTLHNGLFNSASTFSPASTGPQRGVTVPEREGTNGINWRSSGGSLGVYDPRAVLVNRSPEVLGEDGATEVWQFAPYQASDAPIRLASGIEARLIEAEAALQTGDATTWLAIHNALRATVSWPAGQSATLTDPGTEAGRVDLHFRERAFWLFLTGHRLGDLRRLVRQYGRNAETVFPTGAWRDGLLYGSATNMAPPGTQTANPHYSGCLNRDA